MKSDDVAKLVGIMSHFVYWAVFGNFNQLQIDNYHMDKMLRSILEQVKGVEGKFIEGIVEEFEAARKRKEKVKEK